jgi:hypothetical protein
MNWTDLTAAQQTAVMAAAPSIIASQNQSDYFASVDSQGGNSVVESLKSAYNGLVSKMGYTVSSDLAKASAATKQHFISIIQKTILNAPSSGSSKPASSTAPVTGK